MHASTRKGSAEWRKPLRYGSPSVFVQGEAEAKRSAVKRSDVDLARENYEEREGVPSRDLLGFFQGGPCDKNQIEIHVCLPKVKQKRSAAQ